MIVIPLCLQEDTTCHCAFSSTLVDLVTFQTLQEESRVMPPVCGQLQSADNKQKLWFSAIKRLQILALFWSFKLCFVLIRKFLLRISSGKADHLLSKLKLLLPRIPSIASIRQQTGKFQLCVVNLYVVNLCKIFR